VVPSSTGCSSTSDSPLRSMKEPTPQHATIFDSQHKTQGNQARHSNHEIYMSRGKPTVGVPSLHAAFFEERANGFGSCHNIRVKTFHLLCPASTLCSFRSVSSVSWSACNTTRISRPSERTLSGCT
jgi:hypothetical protein